jgi:hypothetical protein
MNWRSNMKRALMLSLLALGCAGEDSVDNRRYAVDTDASGAVDCSDLDHVVTCLTREHDDPTCAEADVNHDGAVDDADLHDLYAGLHETGHDCSEPEHHHDEDHDPASGH